MSSSQDLDRECLNFSLGEIESARSWQYAIVVQGPYIRGHTNKVVQLFLERNSNAIVIVSTYLPEDSSPEELLSQEEFQLVSGGPGRLVYLFLELPSRSLEPEFWRTNIWNQNSHRLSTFAGLRMANSMEIPFSLKIRSDAFLGKRNICEYLYESFVQAYPPIPHPDTRKPAGRIVVGEYSKRRSENQHWPQICDHDISDFWFFGHTTDLMIYFEVRQGSQWNRGSGITTKTYPETNLAELWMKEMQIPLTMDLSEVMGRYMAVASSLEIEFNWLKRWHPDYQRYLKQGKTYLQANHEKEMRRWRLITQSKWQGYVKDHSV